MLHIATFLILSTVQSGSRMPSWAPTATLSSTEFALVSSQEYAFPSGEAGGYVSLKRVADNVGFLITANFLPNRVSEFEFPTIEVREYETRDRIPLGDQFVLDMNANSKELRIYTSYDRLQLVLTCYVPVSPGSRLDQKVVRDYTNDIPLSLAALRETIARFASKRASGRTSMTLSGRSVESFNVSGSAAQYVALEEYALAYGATLSKNEKDWRYSLTVGGTEVVVALGTNKVKVGGNWLTMLDVPILKDGKVWVPMERLPQ